LPHHETLKGSFNPRTFLGRPEAGKTIEKY
jgi:hypothetical protein